MTEPRTSRRWHYVLIGLVVTATAAIVIFRGRPIGDENGFREGPGKSAGDPTQAISLLNESIALLENGQNDAAVEKFSELAKLAPQELAAARNHAIAALMAIAPEALDKVRNAERYEHGLTIADKTVAKLRTLDPKSPVAALLAAKLAENQGDRTKQFAFLDDALKLSDDDPVLAAELYLASRAADDKAAQDAGLAALKRAGEKATDNLWLLTELAVAQATVKDTDVAKTLGRLRDASQPFVEFVQKLRNVNLLDLLNQATTAVEAGDWNTVTRNARLVSNLLKPEIATKLDQRRLVKHLLEYVIADFSPQWYQLHATALAEAAESSAAPIQVTFAEASASDQLPPLAGIRDVKICDFDLDGRWDVVVLLSGQVIVFGQPDSAIRNERWVTLCEAVVPSGMTKLAVCDLDRDTEDTPDEHRFIGQGTSPKDKTPDGAVDRVEDADVDLLVYGTDGVLFLRNQFDKETKARSLQQVAQDADFEALRNVLAIAPADIDHDGDLDLVVSAESGMSIWQNNDSREHTKFLDISSRSALPPRDLKPTVLLPVDWNFDVQTDVLLTGPHVDRPGYLENISHGRVRWREFPPNYGRVAVSSSLRLLGLQTRPLAWHLLATGKDFFRNASSTATDVPLTKHVIHSVRDSSSDEKRQVGLFQEGVPLLADFNNDGKREWLHWDSDRRRIWTSGEAPSSPQTIHEVPEDSKTTVVMCEIADFDADGDEDVLVVTDQRADWIRNDGGNKNGWIDLSIHADKDRKPQRDSERVNIHGVGSLVELRAVGLPEVAGRKTHVRVVEGQSTHFGLGFVKEVDAARIIWTNGIPQNILKPRSGEAIAAQQILKGSCPYLYTWDGEQWAFYTDCLWAAPIGLQLAEGVLAPSREWEYLKIDGDRLRETNCEYRLMLTEELWEAAYFDQVRLLAVDHPADVDIFTNEKVGPPNIAEFKLHPVRKRHTPVAARDHRGRDVLDKIARRDERYLRAFDKVIQQGLTEGHFIQLELGDLSGAKNVTLFLTGWIFPTDTSINVSLSQNPDRAGPQPPSIWVLDNAEMQSRGDAEERQENWREAIPYIGFPGGQTKTIAVDVSAALGLGSEARGQRSEGRGQESAGTENSIRNPRSAIRNRLRLVTSMELYWDEIFFTVDEPPLEFTQTELPLHSADLQYRGFSARLSHPEFGPERFDAANVTTEWHWPPMGGKFTRYGDVTELLTEADDRMAIIGSGDAVTLRFRADQAPKLPPGWKRDFVMHNIGWDKDADLNTIYGQFVEPLPFRTMRGYPDPTGEEYPDTPTHRDYLRRYQTREQNRAAFWSRPILP